MPKQWPNSWLTVRQTRESHKVETGEGEEGGRAVKADMAAWRAGVVDERGGMGSDLDGFLGGGFGSPRLAFVAFGEVVAASQQAFM